MSTASQAHEQYEEDSDSARTPKQETLAKIPGHSRPAYNAAEYTRPQTRRITCRYGSNRNRIAPCR